MERPPSGLWAWAWRVSCPSTHHSGQMGAPGPASDFSEGRAGRWPCCSSQGPVTEEPPRPRCPPPALCHQPHLSSRGWELRAGSAPLTAADQRQRPESRTQAGHTVIQCQEPLLEEAWVRHCLQPQATPASERRHSTAEPASSGCARPPPSLHNFESQKCHVTCRSQGSSSLRVSLTDCDSQPGIFCPQETPGLVWGHLWLS
nr:uncharacterized protein LOC105485752 [Macaca nemestrina]